MHLRLVYFSATLPLAFNSSKIQLIWFGIKQQLLKLDLPLLSPKYPAFIYSSSVHNLGITLKSTLTFSEHLSTLSCSCYHHLRPIRRFVDDHPLLSQPLCMLFSAAAMTTATHLFAKTWLPSLQSALKSAARLIAHLPCSSHISTSQPI